jgi:hypothetical protein
MEGERLADNKQTSDEQNQIGSVMSMANRKMTNNDHWDEWLSDTYVPVDILKNIKDIRQNLHF